MHPQLEYGDIQSLTSSWQWQEPMLLLKRYPQNKQEGLVRYRLQRFQSSHLQLGHGKPWHFIRKSRAAWKRGNLQQDLLKDLMNFDAKDGGIADNCRVAGCGCEDWRKVCFIGTFFFEAFFAWLISSFEGQQVFCCC